MVFVARIVRHKLCMIYAFFDFFVQKSFLNKNCLLTAEINLTIRGPLYTCVVQHGLKPRNNRLFASCYGCLPISAEIYLEVFGLRAKNKGCPHSLFV